MKKFHAKSGNKVLALVLTAAMVLGLAGCGSTEMPAGSADDATVEGTSEAGAAGEAASGEKIVNIGVTDSLGSINPFVIDQTFINKYAVDLEFLPLVDFAEDLSFEYLLAIPLPQRITKISLFISMKMLYGQTVRRSPLMM